MRGLRLGLGLSLTGSSAPTWTPDELFASSEAGAIYEPSDLSSMFQDSAGTTPAVVGQPVGYIADKSGNGLTLTQATTAAKPTLQQDASGFKYLDADGIDDFLASTAASLRITGNLTIVMAVRKDAASRYDVFMSCQTNAATVNQYEFRTSNTGAGAIRMAFVSADGTTAESDETGDGFITHGANKIISLRRTSGAEIEYGVGNTTTTDAHTVIPTSDASSEFRLFSRKGSALYMDGRIYFALVINRLLTSQELTTLKSYIASTTGVTV